MNSSAGDLSRPSRSFLLRWLGWFGIVNGLLFALVGVRYLLAFGVPESGIAFLYLVLAFVGQFALLGFLPLMLLLGPVAILLPRKLPVMVPAVLLAALVLTILVLDTNIFAQYRYHLSRLTVEIFETSTWVFAGVIFTVLLLFQSIVAGNIWQGMAGGKLRFGVRLALVLSAVWIGGQSIHIWADATAYAPVTGFTRYLPVYYPMKAKRRLAQLGLVDPEQVAKQRMLRRVDAPDGGQLRYPLAPLVCKADAEGLPNIVFIVVDALRPDRIDAAHTPRIRQFADTGLQFTNHFSGGNSSRMGFFSLFYGLPSTYWQTFYDLQRSPVLMQQLQAFGYEMQAFSSVSYGSPSQIDRTVFADLSPDVLFLATRDSDTNPNSQVTHKWQEWLNTVGAADEPFFNFLYFDPGNSAGEPVIDNAGAGAAERREAQYLNGISAIDQEVSMILDSLAEYDSERETMVIIASDHGYEFDELGLGNIGHGSNYGPYQLRSVLLMHWPGKEPQVFNQRSAHQDVPGTLLQDLLKCDNPVADYSSGGNLLSGESWDWMMAGSYSSHAIVQSDKIIVTYPGGLVELLGPDYKPAPGLELDAGRIEEAMLEMRRFYK